MGAGDGWMLLEGADEMLGAGVNVGRDGGADRYTGAGAGCGATLRVLGVNPGALR
jgi:hypothetical protein